MKIKKDKINPTELCRLALKLYEENTDESKKELLKKNLQCAYEAIPKTRRRYVLGDMDLHDGPIRDIVYGEHNIIGWDYKSYIENSGELYLPHFNEAHRKLEFARKSGFIDFSNPPEDDIIFAEVVDLIIKSGTVSFPKIMRHFQSGYAKARRLLKELEKAKIIKPIVDESKAVKVLIKHGNDDSVWKNPSVDVDAKRGYKASVSVEEIWNKLENGTIDKNLCIPLGQDKDKQDYFLNLKNYLHILVGGVALSGVGMFRRVTLATLLKFNQPEDLKFILIDPLKISFFDFKKINEHLIFPIITENKEAIKALEWAVKETDKRFKILIKSKIRNIEEYNKKNPKKKIPAILIMITELGELMKFDKEKVEELIARTSNMAKATGIYFILTTQRLSVDTLSGLIKSNMCNRIAFQSGSKEASHLILDKEGAENLLGQGDMMVLTCDSASIKRLQGYCLREE